MTCETPKRTGQNGWPIEKNHVFQNISLQQTSFTTNIVHPKICSATAMKLCNIEELPTSDENMEQVDVSTIYIIVNLVVWDSKGAPKYESLSYGHPRNPNHQLNPPIYH